MFTNLLLIEIVNDNTDKQIQAEEWATDDEDDKIDIAPHGRLVFGLAVFASDIDRIVHDFEPAHEGGDLEQGQVAIPDVVKVDVWHFPVDNAGS